MKSQVRIIVLNSWKDASARTLPPIFSLFPSISLDYFPDGQNIFYD